MSTATLVLWLVTGAVGMGYFVYGKRQSRFAALIAGAALCVYPYFFDNFILLCLIGLALMAAPFFLDF